MTTNSINWKPYQEDVLSFIFNSTEDIVIVWLGIRSGKTLMAQYFTLKQWGEVTYVAGTYNKCEMLDSIHLYSDIFGVEMKVNKPHSIISTDLNTTKVITYNELRTNIIPHSTLVLDEPDAYIKAKNLPKFMELIKTKNIKQVVIFGTMTSTPSFMSELITVAPSLSLIKKTDIGN